MSSTFRPEYDLAAVDSWRGIRPGMSRSATIAALKNAGAEVDDDVNDPEWSIVPDLGMELRFDEEEPHALRQITIDSEEFHWNGKPLLGQSLNRVVGILGKAAEGAAWRPEHAVDRAFDDLQPLESGPFADEMLLSEGSLWLPSRSIALAFERGIIREVAWRRPEDAPSQFSGRVTPEQIQLASRPDLEEYLQSWPPRAGWSTFQLMLTGVFVLSLIFIAVFAFQERQHWQASLAALAKVTAVAPASAATGAAQITVEFADPDGRRQSAVIPGHEFFIAPRAAGENIEIRYLTTEPVQVRGPARVQNAGMLDRLPWAIGAAAVYALGMTGASFVRRMRRSAPSSATTPLLPRTH